MPVLIATLGQAASYLVPVALFYGVLGILATALKRVIRGTPPLGRFAARLGQVALVLAAMFGLTSVVIGIAALGCHPGDYECPV